VNFDLDVSPGTRSVQWSSHQLTCNKSVIRQVFCHLLSQACTLGTNIGVINRVAAAAVTAVIGMTTPSLQRDFGNLFEHLSDPAAKLLMTADWPWSVSLLSLVSRVVPKRRRKRRRMGEHETTSESQTSEFYPSAATRRCNPMKPRFTGYERNACRCDSDFESAEGDPPRAKKKLKARTVLPDSDCETGSDDDDSNTRSTDADKYFTNS